MVVGSSGHGGSGVERLQLVFSCIPGDKTGGLDLERRKEWSSFSLSASLFCLPGASPANACCFGDWENVIN